ncbi:MAG: alpha/beta hydrolase [Clostridiales bacterium]|nr:alpha/beta hydrolase [Clostridiales bacterium]
MRLDPEIVHLDMEWGGMKMIVLRPRNKKEKLPGILWLHGGGYFEGGPEMVFVSKGMDAARKFGAVLVSPEYRLSGTAPYPAALDDAYAALKWLNDNREKLGVDRIMVGGESAGGGLAAALCMLARDRGEIEISYQMPLYPMLDCDDTESSRDNNNPLFWNTKRNHEAWKQYLGELWGSDDVPPYASPAKQTDYSRLPPCYTFVADGEPFYCETLEYVRRLNEAGVEAHTDVFHADQHAFDAVFPWKKISKEAKAKFLERFAEQLEKNRT